jgi:hypothetical protein
MDSGILGGIGEREEEEVENGTMKVMFLHPHTESDVKFTF